MTVFALKLLAVFIVADSALRVGHNLGRCKSEPTETGAETQSTMISNSTNLSDRLSKL